MFSKSNAQQNTSAVRLDAIADDDGFEEYDPAAYEIKSPEASPEVPSDDQFMPGTWRNPRPSVRLAKSSGPSVPGQGREAVSRSRKRPDSGQWEAYDPAAFESTPAEIPGDNKTPHVRLPSSNPSEAVNKMPSPKVSPHGRNTKLVMAESAEAAGRDRTPPRKEFVAAETARRARTSPHNEFVANAEWTLNIHDSSKGVGSSPRGLADLTVEPSAKDGKPIRGANQSIWPLGDSSTQQAVGQGGSGGWAAFDAAYKAKFGEAIPPSGTAAVARKLGSSQLSAVQEPKGRNLDPTVEALTATLTLHSSGNTTRSHRLASPQPSMISTLGNKSQHHPPEADEPLKEWPFRDLRVDKTPAGDKVDPNFRLPKAEPAPGVLKEWPFKGFKMASITDRDRSGSGSKQSGLGAVIGPQSSRPPTVDQSTMYAESTLVYYFLVPSSPLHSRMHSLLTESGLMVVKRKIKTV